MSSAVIAGELQHVSASQLQTYARCPRRWWFQKVAKIPEPAPGRGLVLGQAGHKRLEHYFKTGDGTKLKPMELHAIKAGVYPVPGTPGTLVEQKLVGPGLSLGGVRVDGSIDLLELGPAGIRITDHKFRGANGWAYKSNSLDLRDPTKASGTQMLVYFVWATLRFLASELFTLRHVSHRTEGAPAHDVAETVVARDEAGPAIEFLAALVPGMQETAKQTDPFAVEGNLDACFDYGKCPFFSRCHPNGKAGSMEHDLLQLSKAGA
jgi:hypothetical protein